LLKETSVDGVLVRGTRKKLPGGIEMPDEKRLCERCRVEIPAARLEALPETRLCVKCSQEVGGEFEIIVVLGSLGKQGSLKKNYGDAEVIRRRRRLPPKEES